MNVETLNIRHLLAANLVWKGHSINHAAEELYLSQPAISQGIKKLEQQLACKLIERSRRGTQASALGEVFFARVERALGLLDKIATALPIDKRHNFSRTVTATLLRAFSYTVRAESTKRAADQLQLSQPTVHRAIADFEQLCNTEFFYRSSYGSQPTRQAKYVAQHIELFYSELQQAVDAMEQSRGERIGRLAIGSLPLARSDWAPNAVSDLLADYPAADVSIYDGPYEAQLHELMHGRIDMIIGALREQKSGLPIVQRAMFDDELSVVVRTGHPLSALNQVSVADLVDFDWITPHNDTPGRQVFEQVFIDAGLHVPKRIIECGSFMAVRKLLMVSDRATLLSSRQVGNDVAANLLTVLPLQLPATTRKIGVSFRKGWQPTALQQRFIDLLGQSAASV